MSEVILLFYYSVPRVTLEGRSYVKKIITGS